MPDPSLFEPALPAGQPTPDPSTRPAGVAGPAPGAGEAELLAGLDQTQAAAAGHPGGPLLVVAGPGSGKTRMLTHRVAVMLRRGVPPWRILAVTFTNKAAAEMRERIGALVDAETARQLWVCTVHAACVRILRAEHEAVGLRRDFVIADASDTERLLRVVAKELRVTADDADVRAYARAARSAISSARNRRQSLLRVGVRAGLDRLVEVEAEYRSRLRASGMVDFDDLLVLTHALLTEDAEARDRWASRWLFVAQDEAQDANLVQSELIAALASVHRNVTYVGDFDQSIYRFRGAEPEALARFDDEWAGGSVVALGHNYRSSEAIVSAAAAVIAPNEGVHRAHQTPGRPGGEPVVVHRSGSDRDEASWVVSRLRSLGGDWAECAVLVRTNAQTRVLEEALLSSQVPYRLVGDVRFYDRAEVRDALAWLRLAVNPADALALERCAAAPRRGLGPAALARVVAHVPPGGDLVAAAGELGAAGGRGAAALAGFADDVAQVRAAAQSSGPAAALRSALATGLAAQWAADVSGESRVENLNELVAAAEVFVRDGRDMEGRAVAGMSAAAASAAFLEFAALVAAADDEAVDAVSVMTIHAAKGREFDSVFVVGLEEELLPHVHSLDDPRDVAEERRLLFVAMTRARHRLFLSYAAERFRFGRVVDSTPSRFLRDLPDGVQRSGGPGVGRRTPPTWGASTVPRRRPGGSSSKSSSWGSSSGRSGSPLAATPPPPRPAGPRVPLAQLAAGVGVVHDHFGDGVVTEVRDALVTVRFADGKSRTLQADLAPLRLR